MQFVLRNLVWQRPKTLDITDCETAFDLAALIYTNAGTQSLLHLVIPILEKKCLATC
jgi:hypothetical protein